MVKRLQRAQSWQPDSDRQICLSELQNTEILIFTGVVLLIGLGEECRENFGNGS